jgi:hypothetical protein
MPYIGNDIQYGELNSQTFTGDGSTTAFTLTYTVSNVNSLLVTVADVIQEPTTAYTVSGTTLTFTSAPANLDTIHVRYLGRTLDVGTTAIVQDSDQDTLIQVEESADEDTIRFDTGGTERVTINSTSVTSTIPLYIPDGSASTPSVTNTGDTNTGIFFPAADTVGVAVGGTEVWRYGSNPTTAKNLIQNGAMTVDQRSAETRTDLGATTAYHIDRWKYEKSGTATARFTLDNTAVASLGVGGSIKTTVTTTDAALDAAVLYMWTHYIEAQNLQHLNYGQADAKSITVSFWADAPAGNYTFKVLAEDINRTYATAFALAGSGLEKVTITVPGDTSGGITNDNGRGLQLIWTMAGGSNFQGGTTDAWTAYGLTNMTTVGRTK